MALSGCTGSHDPQVPSAGGTPSTTGTPDASSQEFAFVACMRDHGIADMPDPVPGDTSGRSAVRYALDVMGKGSDRSFQTALDACLSLLPALPPPPPPPADEVEAMRQFAQCMRDHGVANFPDPTPDGTLLMVVVVDGAVAEGVGVGTTDEGTSYYALDLNNPTDKAAFDACKSLLPTSE
jgi:hypothetical protein